LRALPSWRNFNLPNNYPNILAEAPRGMCIALATSDHQEDTVVNRPHAAKFEAHG
jgi:hypothetical protein